LTIVKADAADAIAPAKIHIILQGCADSYHDSNELLRWGNCFIENSANQDFAFAFSPGAFVEPASTIPKLIARSRIAAALRFSRTAIEPEVSPQLIIILDGPWASPHHFFTLSPSSTVSGRVEWLRSLAQARIVFPSRVSRP
jgi:hypothetical protein